MTNDDNISAKTAENSALKNLLSDMEVRVLGCLMEKQLTVPEQYPLTLNALVVACNQKTSRYPVLNLQLGEVQHCVNSLRDRELIEIEYGSRVDKYKQRLTRHLHWDRTEHAIFTLLMLRGPLTLNELFARGQRMHQLDDIKGIQDKIEILLAKRSPILVQLPRIPGQRENRFMHLLCGEPDIAMQLPEPKRVENQHFDPANTIISQLSDRLKTLEEKVAQLAERLDGLH